MTSDKRVVIGLVGRKGSGKGTVAKILKDEYGAIVFRYSDILRDIVRRLSLPESRDNLIKASVALRQCFGEDIFKRALVTDAGQTSTSIIVIDGIRRFGDLEGLEALGPVYLIDITAPLETRFERIQQRGENQGETTSTFEAFKNEEQAPTETTIGEVEAKAWKTIQNIGSHEDLIATVKALVAEARL